MTSASKLIQASAGNAAGEATYVESVFSTYLYTGNFSTQTITNGIDLDGEGGLVWIKNRSYSYQHHLVDTERGPTKKLATNSTSGEVTQTNNVDSFNSDGFSINFRDEVNSNNRTYASWTFRKAPKFFDVVTYTGSGAETPVSHSLDSVPGMVIIKRTDSTGDWYVGHRGTGSYYLSSQLVLNSTASGATNGVFGASFTSTQITPSGNADISGASYVAYLFAHNDGDGEFGEDADQDIIKCGSYSGNGGTQEIDLGFEAQWVMIKKSSGSGLEGWVMQDVMRGMHAAGATHDDRGLLANSSTAEFSINNIVGPTANGFFLERGDGSVNASGSTYIYIAIRRGPMKTPESGTEVFAIDTLGSTGDGNEPGLRSGFPVDWLIWRPDKNTSESPTSYQRLTSSNLITSSTAAESVSSTYATWFQYMNGWLASTSTDANDIAWMFRRAPGFFDVVAYEGTGSTQTVDHNLGVTPEIMIVKRRDTAGYNWAIYTSALGATKLYNGFGAGGPSTNPDWWNDTAPTDSVFTVNTQASVNASGGDYIAYLFASLDGISKIGTYTGNGSTQTINCGFSSGARFILIRPTTTDGNWVIFDSERGIVAGNDPYLKPGDTSAEATNDDGVDPDSSGFIVNELTNSGTSLTKINQSGVSYTFLAIA